MLGGRILSMLMSGWSKSGAVAWPPSDSLYGKLMVGKELL